MSIYECMSALNLCLCMYEFMSTRMYVYISMYVMNVCLRVNVCQNTWMYVYIWIYVMNVCIHMNVCQNIWVCVYIWMYVNIHNIHKLFHFEIQTKKTIWGRMNCVATVSSIPYIFIWMYVNMHNMHKQKTLFNLEIQTKNWFEKRGDAWYLLNQYFIYSYESIQWYINDMNILYLIYSCEYI